MTFSGRCALVSGGSRGIGRAIVLELASSGCRVAFTYRESEDLARLVVSEAEEAGGQALALPADSRNVEQLQVAFREALAFGGQVDYLVNNAGIIRPRALAFMTNDDWSEVLETNLFGAFFLTRAFVQHRLKGKSPGSVVNVSSVTGSTGADRQSNYAASKGALIAMTKSLSREISPFGIRINAVAPGYIETDMVEGVDQEQRRALAARIPLGRLGNAVEVARAVSFLLSDAASYVTGSLLTIDGGLTA